MLSEWRARGFERLQLRTSVDPEKMGELAGLVVEGCEGS